MNIAKAMALGGRIVNADDCDFSSYVKLGLRCPVCREPVCLRKGTIRKPYFAHFKGTDSTQIEQCELRVATYGTTTKNSIFIEDRGQRFKIFQKQFLRMISIDKHSIFVNIKVYNWINSVQRNHKQAVNSITKACVQYFLKHQKTMESMYITSLKQIGDNNTMLQNQIALEAMDYLSLKSSALLLEQLIYYSIYKLYKQQENNFFRENIGEKHIENVCHYAAKIIIFNPWVKAFSSIQ